MSETDHAGGTRRDFIYYATAGVGAITAGAAIWPLINQTVSYTHLTLPTILLV